MASLTDLDVELKAQGIPIVGLSGDIEQLDKIRIDFDKSATPEQRVQAKSIVMDFKPHEDGLDELVSKLFIQASQDGTKFDKVFSQLSRARLVQDIAVKKQLCADIQAVLES